jgi:hypothetical protein
MTVDPLRAQGLQTPQKGLSVTSKSVKQKRLLELDMLRALAIIMIVVAHTVYYVTRRHC